MSRLDIPPRFDDGGEPDVLRFITAGSVDDGKSTLIGRLLFDSKALLRDQVAALSRAKGAQSTTADGDIDLALVTDGLESEREQGITIDVAYRYFATPRRSFVIADAPGHEQYTRNMVTAASNAELAIILIDASRAAGKGLKAQTRRHATIAKLMGLKVIVAINKMDLTGWSRAVFDEIRENFTRVARTLGIADPIYVPIAAKHGDNVARPSPHTPWYEGPPLLDLLETIDVTRDRSDAFRFPVQRVLRTAQGARAYAGRVESGALRPGDEVRAMPSGQTAIVESIRSYDGAYANVGAGQSVSIVLDRDLDIGRGDTLTSIDQAGAWPFKLIRMPNERQESDPPFPFGMTVADVLYKSESLIMIWDHRESRMIPCVRRQEETWTDYVRRVFTAQICLRLAEFVRDERLSRDEAEKRVGAQERHRIESESAEDAELRWLRIAVRFSRSLAAPTTASRARE